MDPPSARFRSGRESAVTPIQLAAAYAAIANKGVWVQPNLVARIGEERLRSRNGDEWWTAAVAKQLMTMLSKRC